MNKVLVTYATLAGSTADVARVVGEELAAAGYPADVLPMSAAPDPSEYQAVVLGGPMIMGWHRQALGYLRRHRRALQQKPVAVFVLAMSLTDTGTTQVRGVPVQIDERLPKPLARPGRPTFRERFTDATRYLAPIVNALRPAQPAALGLFGGRLEYGRLPVWAVLFAMFVIRAPAGDKRNWPAIHAWAKALPQALKLGHPESAELELA